MESKMKKFIIKLLFSPRQRSSELGSALGLTKRSNIVRPFPTAAQPAQARRRPVGLAKTWIYAASFAAGMLLAGCDTDDEYRAAEPELYLTASTRIFALSADGGQRTVVIDTNCGEWKVTTDAAGWLSNRKEGNLLTITAGESLSTKAQTAVVTVSSIDDPSLTCEIRVMQYGTGATNLSALGTANCYMASTGASYVFDASIKGNGLGDGNSEYIDKHGLLLDEGVAAELLWEAVFDADKTRSRDVIDGEPVYRNGRIWFTTGREQGNAVIALRDFSGEIVWSWHIWMAQAPAEQTVNGRTFLDRNVGATEFDGALVGSLGVYFQWGRKDPFIGANRIQKNYTDEYEGVGFQTTGDNGFTALFLYNDALCEGFKFVNKEMDMSMSIANPTVFYGVYNSGGWKGSNSEVEDYWGGASGTKTNNDPCPAGYRVPTFDEINGFIKDIDTNKTAQENVSDQSYGRKYTVGDQTFMFPGSALRVWSAKMRYPGRVTFFWSSTISPTTEKKALDFYDYRWNTNADNTCCAMAVRCIKIQ